MLVGHITAEQWRGVELTIIHEHDTEFILINTQNLLMINM